MALGARQVLCGMMLLFAASVHPAYADPIRVTGAIHIDDISIDRGIVGELQIGELTFDVSASGNGEYRSLSPG